MIGSQGVGEAISTSHAGESARRFIFISQRGDFDATSAAPNSSSPGTADAPQHDPLGAALRQQAIDQIGEKDADCDARRAGAPPEPRSSITNGDVR